VTSYPGEKCNPLSNHMNNSQEWLSHRNLFSRSMTNFPNCSELLCGSFLIHSKIVVVLQIINPITLLITFVVFLNRSPSIPRPPPSKTRKESLHARMPENAPYHRDILQTCCCDGEKLPEKVHQSVYLHDHPNYGPSK